MDIFPSYLNKCCNFNRRLSHVRKVGFVNRITILGSTVNMIGGGLYDHFLNTIISTLIKIMVFI